MHGNTEAGVSFVVTVYNKAPWLPDVCKQIAAQRGSFAREYIFVDDGSTDNSVEIIERCTAGWENVRLYRQANAGPAAATNAGFRLAKYPFVKLVDADDLLHADATQYLLDALMANPDATAAYGKAKSYDAYINPDLSGHFPLPVARIIHDPIRQSIRNTPFTPSMALVRRNAVRKADGCDERLWAAQDLTLALRISLLGPFVSLAVPVAFIPQDVPGRVGTRQNLQLQRGNQALALFLQDHPELPWRLKQLACRRAAGRAWKYVNRVTGANALTSQYFWHQVRALLPFFGTHADFILKCADGFDLEA